MTTSMSHRHLDDAFESDGMRSWRCLRRYLNGCTSAMRTWYRHGCCVSVPPTRSSERATTFVASALSAWRCVTALHVCRVAAGTSYTAPACRSGGARRRTASPLAHSAAGRCRRRAMGQIAQALSQQFSTPKRSWQGSPAQQSFCLSGSLWAKQTFARLLRYDILSTHT